MSYVSFSVYEIILFLVCFVCYMDVKISTNRVLKIVSWLVVAVVIALLSNHPSVSMSFSIVCELNLRVTSSLEY
jgi:hypothetical protein